MSVFRRFKADQNGTSAVIFGLAVMPLMLAAGGAVDYSRAAAEHTRMQRAVDSAVLTLVREPKTATQSELAAKAKLLFQAVYPASPDLMLQPPVVERNGTTIKLSQRGTMKNAFMKVVGLNDTVVAASATASWSSQRIELALVLDNTGSMREEIAGKVKMSELKRASLNLLQQLRGAAADKDDVRVSVVPFDTEVRVEPRYRNGDWLRFDGRHAAADRRNWTGYIVDRDQPKDVTDDRPVMSLDHTLYPAHATSEWADQGLGDLAFVQPLTSLYDDAAYAAVQGTINAMKPRGNTNVGLGVSWGLGTLTGSIPLDTAATGDPRGVKRFMVVLTDGTNTQKWVDGTKEIVANPDNPSPSDPVLRRINDSTAKACTTAKNANVEVFTIRLLKGDQDLLGSCASLPNDRIDQHYFNVQSGPELDAAFRKILDSISGTRLTN